MGNYTFFRWFDIFLLLGYLGSMLPVFQYAGPRQINNKFHYSISIWFRKLHNCMCIENSMGIHAAVYCVQYCVLIRAHTRIPMDSCLATLQKSPWVRFRSQCTSIAIQVYVLAYVAASMLLLLFQSSTPIYGLESLLLSRFLSTTISFFNPDHPTKPRYRRTGLDCPC